ncbi:putative nad dependent epimerase dehydratase family protein [Fusarium sp. Ph1]|nr:putative nad dependent epimerase dehydratase family protein [Fusarium sp. Ph1]
MTTPRSLLLTGATGYIGGTVLDSLLKSPNTQVRDLAITVVVRKQDQLYFFNEKNIKTALVSGGLEDSEKLTNLARQHDVVLDVATGFNTVAVKAFIKGLAQRKRETDVEPFYIHASYRPDIGGEILSGTTNLSVSDITGRGGELITFSDKEEGIYEYEVKREVDDPYEQRTADVATVEAGEQLNVRTYIVMPPVVWGAGTGYFHRFSKQVPQLITNALKVGQVQYPAPDTSAVGRVHVTDLASLFEAILTRAIVDPYLPSGRRGFFFAETGRQTWLEVAEKIIAVGNDLGYLESLESVGLSLQHAADTWFNGQTALVERIFCSTSSTQAHRGYGIGWKPEKTDDDWNVSFVEAVQAAKQQAEFEGRPW